VAHVGCEPDRRKPGTQHHHVPLDLLHFGWRWVACSGAECVWVCWHTGRHPGSRTRTRTRKTFSRVRK
jgi:hypothetical protein